MKKLLQWMGKEYSTPMIFVDNDAVVFFDVNESDGEPTNVAELMDNPTKKRYRQPYNFLVKAGQEHYFRTDNYEGPLRTVSVTTTCIVFCAFIGDENRGIKSSGVYHAESLPPSDKFQNRLYQLIDTVSLGSDEKVTVKAVGSNENEHILQKIRDDITGILAAKDIEMGLENLLLGGGYYRRTEFYPLNGQLITYFSNGKQKTIL